MQLLNVLSLKKKQNQNNRNSQVKGQGYENSAWIATSNTIKADAVELYPLFCTSTTISQCQRLCLPCPIRPELYKAFKLNQRVFGPDQQGASSCRQFRLHLMRLWH